MQLRPYQSECLDAIALASIQGCNRQLIVLPTASGKTLCFAQLPTRLRMRRPDKMLVLVQSDELCYQSVEKLQLCNPTLKIGLEKAQYKSTWSDDIVVASIQSLAGSKKNEETDEWEWSKRLLTMDRELFRYVIVDECHHLCAPIYHGPLRYFKVFKQEPVFNDPTRFLLGVTATPNRADNKGLEGFFDKIVYSRDIKSMVTDGWLAAPEAHRIDTMVNLDQVDVRRGDFVTAQLEKAVNIPQRNNLIVDKYLELGEGAPFLAFTVDIQHTIDLTECFRARGIACFGIASKSDKTCEWLISKDSERKDVIERYNKGDFAGLISCQALCLDQETEILTSQGWVGIDDMTECHKVANWDNGTIYFEEPKRIIRRQRMDGEKMVSLMSQDFDIRVTEDHRMLYKTWPVPHARFKHAKAIDLVGRFHIVPCSGQLQSPLDAVVDQEPRTKKAVLVRALSFALRKNNGFSAVDSRLEAVKRVDRKLSLRYKQPSELTLDECRFIGFWVGDGTTSKLIRCGVEHILCQSTRYPIIIAWIRSLLTSMGIDYIERNKKAPRKGKNSMPYIVWSIPRGTGGGAQQRDGIYHLEPYLQKHGSPLWWGFTSDQFAAFLDGLWMADGNHGLDGVKKKRSFHIHGTIERKCLSVVQAIACCHGYYTNLTVKHRQLPHHHIQSLTLKKSSIIRVSTKRLKEEADWRPERVWCVTTTSGNIVTRRNGKVVVTGNCEGFDAPRAMIGLDTAPTRSRLRFTQKFGRILRPFPAPEAAATWTGWRKRCAIWLDFVDSSSKHTLVSAPSLFGLRPDFNAKGKGLVAAVEEIERITAAKPGINAALFTDLNSLRAMSERIDLFAVPTVPPEILRLSKFSWVTGVSMETYQLTLPDKGMLSIKVNALGEYEISKHLTGVKTPLGIAASLEDALKAADKHVPQDAVIMLRSDAGWRTLPASDKQMNALMRLYPQMRSPFPNDAEFFTMVAGTYSRGQVSALISQRQDRMPAKRY